MRCPARQEYGDRLRGLYGTPPLYFTTLTLPGIVMEVEDHLFVEDFMVIQGPMPCHPLR